MTDNPISEQALAELAETMKVAEILVSNPGNFVVYVTRACELWRTCPPRRILALIAEVRELRAALTENHARIRQINPDAAADVLALLRRAET